jgi:hypothetical protein
MRVWASCEALLVPCEALDLLRQAFVERFDGPFGGAIEADERHHHDPHSETPSICPLPCCRSKGSAA